jgi:hypothetical protein
VEFEDESPQPRVEVTLYQEDSAYSFGYALRPVVPDCRMSPLTIGSEVQAYE